MKKYILLALIILTTGCSSSYHKKRLIRLNYHTGEQEYCLWVYKNFSDYEMVLHLPVSQMTNNSIDSMDRVADSIIMKVKELEKEIKNHK